ncbi:MAG: hypothetical protein J1F32_03060 [Erysipelotrichales bacterium]|nr:hypothetical protein [Erysipelotrichales bacterium]
MNSVSKNMFSRLKNEDKYFADIIKKITIGSKLTHDELSFVLSMSIIFLEEYNSTKNSDYFEFSYFLVLSYALSSFDKTPLLDFSINNGFYPISKCLITNENKNIFTSIIEQGIERYKTENIIELKEQKEKTNYLIHSKELYRAYIAPTSFGKSSFIKDDIIFQNNKKVGIIVPKKALIWQIYRDVKDIAKENGYKLLIHDTEYSGEERIIGVFTQERAIRLLQDSNFYFDILYIDEAHNLFEKNDRNILLARLIKLNKKLNPIHKVIFLSPLINNIDNLKIDDNNIDKQKIEFNIKEYRVKYFDLDKNCFSYNRFTDEYYAFNVQYNDWFDYLNKEGKKKNLIYFHRPRDIEKFAKNLCEMIDDLNDFELNQIAAIIEKYVDKEYLMVDSIRRGIIYVHGKIPDSIKDYILTKFKTCDKIKYLISNTSVLEGVNFPIDSLFVLNVRSLDKNNLINLCGRVNRLNEIFTDPPRLDKLFCPIHFVETENYGGKQNFKNKIKLLRCDGTDNVKNPLLTNSDMNTIDRDRIRDLENSYIDNCFDNSIRIVLIKNEINQFYRDFDEIVKILMKRIQNISYPITFEKLVESVIEIFIKDFNNKQLIDFELLRLNNSLAQAFYNYYMKGTYYSDIKSKIKYFIKYFKSCVETNTLFYVGESFGETEYISENYDTKRKTYIDLSTKDVKSKINLAVIKSKLEDDFISYKFSKLVKCLFDLKLITEEVYNKFLYGTTDETTIALLKCGLSYQLINFIENENLKNEIKISETGINVTEKFLNELSKQDDFIRFEIEKII